MKALFIGLGSIGQRHLRNLLILKPTIELSAVRHSRSVPVLNNSNEVVQGADVALHYGITEFHSLDTALNNDPDLIFITNPSSMHCKVAIQCLDTSAYVFIEKPLSNDWQGIEDLLAKEQASGGKRIAIGYQFRFHPALQLVVTMLEENRIGRIVSARVINGEYLPGWHPYEDYRNSYAARRELGGGALVTQIHDFDYAMWLFGKPTSVYAIGGQLSSLEVDVEDSVQVLMNCAKGAQIVPVSIAQDYLQWPPQRNCAVVGDEGRIDCDLIKNTVTLNNRLAGKEECHEFPQLLRNEIFVDEMRNFLAFAAGEEYPAVDLACGMSSLRVAIAARNSMDLGEVSYLNWS